MNRTGLETVRHITSHYYLPVVVSVGLATNILTLIVMIHEGSLLKFSKQAAQIGHGPVQVIAEASAVFRRRHANNHSNSSPSLSFANSFLFALAVSDLLNNILVLVPLLTQINLNLLEVSSVCKIYSLLKHVCRFLSHTFTLMYTIQRFVAVHDPLSGFRKESHSAVKSGSTIVGLVGFACVAYSYVFATFDSVETSSQDELKFSCRPTDKHSNLIRIVENTLDLILSGIIPIFGVLILNLFTCRRLMRVDKERPSSSQRSDERKLKLRARRDGSNMSEFVSVRSSFSSYVEFEVRRATAMSFGQYQRRRNACAQPATAHGSSMRSERARVRRYAETQRVTITLVIVSFTFVALNLPPRALAFAMFLRDSVAFALDTPRVWSRERLFGQVSEDLCSLSFTVNFFLYSMLAKKFRLALKSLFKYVYLSVHARFV
jgi:hypothetical protein